MNPWIAFEDQMPTPPHGRLLVTNNVGAKDAQGFASHVWIVTGVMKDAKGEVKAYAELLILRNLTHWRPALPEEWPAQEDQRDLPDPAHTPGPWTADGATTPGGLGKRYHEIFAPGKGIAHTADRDPAIDNGEDAANARLLAASPMLAETLGLVLEQWANCEAQRCPGDYHEHGMGQLFQYAERLLRETLQEPTSKLDPEDFLEAKP